MSLAQASEPLIRWSWIADHRSEIFDLILAHLGLTAIAVAVGFVLAMALSLVALRWRFTYGPITWAAGVLYTIPSLALFVMLLAWTGLTVLTAEIGLVTYTLLILVRNIVAGIDGVPESVKDAARGMGYGRVRLFVEIELPLALPVILAGVRIATVTTVGLVTVTALIAQQSLGTLILDGLSRFFNTEIIVGAVLSVALAALLDLGLLGVQWALTPWGRKAASR